MACTETNGSTVVRIDTFMSDGHLYLSARGGADYEGDSRHAWYDATHQSVLLLSSSMQLQQLPLDTSLDTVEASTAVASKERNLTPLYDFAEPEVGRDYRKSTYQRSLTPIVLLQMSVDRQFLAIQRSDIEVQVIHRESRASYWILCKSKAGNRILHGGVIWNTHSLKPGSSQDLFLVTKLGLEHHRVSSKRRNCAMHRTVGFYVHEFWYAASHGVLLMSSGSRANEIVPFLLHGANAEKLAKLVFSTSVSKTDLHLVSLYGDTYAVYSDSRSTKLLLYLIGRTKVACVRSLNLLLPPGTALEFSVVDNLLVCHSLDFNVSLFFDIKCDGNISDPFSAPLPISARPPGQPPPETIISSTEGNPSHLAGDTVENYDLEVISDESDQHLFNEPAWGSTPPTRGMCRALSVDDLDVHTYIDDAMLLLPSFKTSPASHLAKRRSTRRLQRAMSTTTLEVKETPKPDVLVSSFTRWRFHAPNLVQRSFSANGHEQVEIRKLQVNLAEVCKTCEHHREILSFLLRRGGHEQAKVLVLRLVRNHIVEQQASLSSIVQLLTTVQTVYGSERRNKSITGSESSDGTSAARSESVNCVEEPVVQGERECIKARPPIRNARGLLLIEQADFYRHVWSEVVQDPNTAKTCDLSIYIVEYIKNLRDNKVPVEDITYIALAEYFIAAGEPGKLYQFLHYHVLTDSLKLADLMVRNGVSYPELMQVGLDMYFRLREIRSLVRTLLDIGQTDRAIGVAWRNMGLTSFDASVLPGVVFFDSLVKSVLSSEKYRSPLEVTQMLGNLLLFLKVWDPAALHVQCSDTIPVSTLANSATVPFPDDLISPGSRQKLRAAFGFSCD